MKKNLLNFFVAACAIVSVSCNEKEKISSEDRYFRKPSDSAQIVSSEKIQYIIDTVAADLQNPWGIEFMPNGDILVTERAGEIRIIREGKLIEQRIQGMPEVYVNGQGGLLDIELHPKYEENGYLYIAYASPAEGGGNTAVMRAKLDGDQLVDKQVIFQATPYTNSGVHFGSRIEFDKEGFMYIAVGERGEMENAQNLGNYNGKTFRLHDDGKIPQDNPFVKTAGAKPEIYTYGNRNIQGMSIHPETGEIWTHEHGPMGGDEINILKAGTNYGWPVITYGINYNGEIISKDSVMEGYAQPLHYWKPSIAPCGMTFVTGDKYPEWKGNLMVGSLKFRYISRCEIKDNKVVHEEKLIENLGRVRAVEQGPDGYLYVATESPGLLVRIYPVEKKDLF